MTFKNSKTPEWEIPENLEEIIAEEESWENEVWLPIFLTVMGGTIYRGREIPLAWQIEFEPGSEEFEIPNEKISELGFEPDGYGWANAIQSVANTHHPEIVSELHFGDTEESTCVIWVESESACKILTQIAWNLINIK